MAVTEIQAKSLLRRRSQVDSWFISDCGMNIYQGCQHNCSYCDGRAEKYGVTGMFGLDVSVKTNAVEILQQELSRMRKQPRGYVMLGGGIGDSYQPIEEHYKLTRQILEVLVEYGLPVHVLTKSTLVHRDADLLRDIHEERGVIISMSFSSVNDEISRIYEPEVPAPSERLWVLRQFKDMDIPCGMFLLPVIPFITDMEEMISESVTAAAAARLNFVIFGGMTLKHGRQREHFLDVLMRNHPELADRYDSIYTEDRWGNAIGSYYECINSRFDDAASLHHMAKRVPAGLYRHILPENDVVAVMLDQLSYLAQLKKKPAPYGYASNTIAKLKKSLSSLEDLTEISGVGPKTAQLIKEILETGRCQYYEDLLRK